MSVSVNDGLREAAAHPSRNVDVSLAIQANRTELREDFDVVLIIEDAEGALSRVHQCRWEIDRAIMGQSRMETPFQNLLRIEKSSTSIPLVTRTQKKHFDPKGGSPWNSISW